jgi:hypothetical protein
VLDKLARIIFAVIIESCVLVALTLALSHFVGEGKDFYGGDHGIL